MPPTRPFWSGTGGTFTVTHTTARPEPQPQAATMRPGPEGCPSAWWTRCTDCGHKDWTYLYMHDDVRCDRTDCHGSRVNIDKGAMWGHEWAAVVAMTQAWQEIDDFRAPYGHVMDDHPF